MNLPKVVLVLALVYAAAILIPLRRAQRLFATPSATLSLSNAPRPSMRRRVTPPRAILRKDVDPGSGAVAAGDATAPAVPRRRLAQISAERHTLEKRQSQPTVAAVDRHAGGVAQADCDRTVEHSVIELGPQPLVRSVEVEGFVAPTQPPADLAAPPPKHA